MSKGGLGERGILFLCLNVFIDFFLDLFNMYFYIWKDDVSC